MDQDLNQIQLQENPDFKSRNWRRPGTAENDENTEEED